jgi:hypothetical protein
VRAEALDGDEQREDEEDERHGQAVRLVHAHVRNDRPDHGHRETHAASGVTSGATPNAPGRALGAIETSVRAGDRTIDEAAVAIVAVVDDFGLQVVEEPALPQRVGIDDLGVVCWMAVLPPLT